MRGENQGGKGERSPRLMFSERGGYRKKSWIAMGTSQTVEKEV